VYEDITTSGSPSRCLPSTDFKKNLAEIIRYNIELLYRKEDVKKFELNYLVGFFHGIGFASLLTIGLCLMLKAIFGSVVV
jgi:hypothetical protein